MAVDPDNIIMKQGKISIVTADNWFRGPDGDNYKHVLGPTYYFEAKELMGFVPKESANWFVVVGDVGEESHGHRQVIAGCQVHYAHVVSDISDVRNDSQNLLDLTL